MYVRREDALILTSDEIGVLLDEYEARFNERFIAFNYVDFRDKDGKLAAEVYKEKIAQALKDNKPYHIVSHRYDVIDH